MRIDQSDFDEGYQPLDTDDPYSLELCTFCGAEQAWASKARPEHRHYADCPWAQARGWIPKPAPKIP